MEVVIFVGILCLCVGFVIGRASAGMSGDAMRKYDAISGPGGGSGNYDPSFAIQHPLPDNVNDAVKELLRRHQKIEAIKVYREKTGCGLKEAKDAVEHVERQM